jgi:predicted secreted protein
MFRHALALSAMTLLACNGCNDKNAPPASSAGPVGIASATAAGAGQGGETVVRAEDDGKSVDVARGETVTFKLASNSGTGYLWVPAQVDTSLLAQQGDRTSEASSDAPGGGKMDVYRFLALKAGSSTVEMSLKRPFGGAPAARALHVTVNVR